MAEFLGEFLIKLVVDPVVGQASAVASVEEEVRKLRGKVETIQPIFEDAHNKQFTSDHIRGWISKVKHIIYDAEDIIDLYNAKARDLEAQTGQGKVRKQLSSLYFMCRNFSFLHKTASEIKKVTAKLNEVIEEKDVYGLAPLTKESGPPQDQIEILCRNRLTTSNITDQNIFGREKDEELVVEWLKESLNSECNRHVMAIVGTGGLGKTTLAKKVCNNSSIKQHFKKSIWICASERPQLRQLMKQILEALEENVESATEKMVETLSRKILRHLKEKRCLLVIDDAWDFEWWSELNGLLQQGAAGTSLLITTRNTEVEKEIPELFSHVRNLSPLSCQESWCLFVNKVLREGETEEELDRVKDVGRAIVKNCQGLPLALSVVGSLLKDKDRKTSDWQKVKNSPFWEWKGIVNNDENKKILSTIALSYMNLPFSLKQCLTYCSMYPKDSPMYKEDLAQLWVAEGFIKEEEEASSGETKMCTAGRYLDLLVGCSLVQIDSELKLYRLHDIVHDFASYMRQNENANLLLPATTSPSQARLLSITNFHKSFIDDTKINQHRKLRTLMLRGGSHQKYLLATILPNLKWLRVLDLSDNIHLEVLPECLGDLLLLKHFNLSNTGIKTLPESVSRLRSLEMLNLSHTPIEMLPKGTSKMRALRHLHLGNEDYFPICMPENIGKLTLLQTLSSFVVGRSNTSMSNRRSIKELRHLNNLEGLLRIHHIERVHSIEDAKNAELHNKTKLHELKLSCGSTIFHPSDTNFQKRIEGIFEELRPPTCLETLEVSYYAGTRFPSWISYLSCLQKVSMTHCSLLKEIPMLACLPNLEELLISNMESLEEWREVEAVPQLSSLKVLDCPKLRVLPAAFPKLESLQIHRMESLEDWSQTTTMCFLRSVEIDDCPKLTTVLGGMPLTAKLRELKLKNLPQLESISLTSLENISELQLHQLPKLDLQEHGFLQTSNAATALKGLDQHGFPTLAMESQMAEEAHENMNQLERLLLSDCPNLAARVADMLQHRHLPHLEHVQICSSNSFEHTIYPKLLSLVLEIESVDGLSRFKNFGNRIDRLVIRLNDRVDLVPEWIQHLRNLKWLVIEDSPMLTQLPEWLGEFSLLQRLELVRLPKLRSLPKGMRSLTQLQELSITSLTGLTQLPESLCESSRLWSLQLQDLPLLRSLPEGMRSLTQLQKLSITGLSGLTQLPEWLCELSQLSSLKLQGLPLLRTLPEMTQPLLHLQTLKITKCPGLRHLPEWIGQLTKLADLELRSLPGLRSLPEGLGRLRCLRWVRLKDMTELTRLPDGMRDLPELQLDVKDCHQLVLHSANVIERRVSGWYMSCFRVRESIA